MVSITVYQKPTCGTCRKVHAALKESGVDFDLLAQSPSITTQDHLASFDTVGNLSDSGIAISNVNTSNANVVGPSLATTLNRPALFANTSGDLLLEAPYTLPLVQGTDKFVLTTNGNGGTLLSSYT